MRKPLNLNIAILLVLMSVLAGCSSKPANANEATSPPGAPKSDVRLTFMTNIVGMQFELLAKICKAFTAETGIEVEAVSPGSAYEEIMKLKMASNELPDLFTTHGWSVARYSGYLRLLNDQAWFSAINPSIQPLITNKNGEIYVLPVDVDVAGIVYNRAMMKVLNINIDELTTWHAFEDALTKVKDAGHIGIHIAGRDSWTIGQFFDYTAPSFFTTNENDNYRKQ
ncbi:ABC transporter substrate-binding protein [Paenibacillus sp. PL91]|uniref:ABC transporter substrate-binding protein n=1 Tax=Paenibacillus sp. PL91 TaxID=2729538 RepID=UPI00145FBBE9|nr:ABC transporter substrate-binding protein [Paenibacillus sp. PL91]MBC9201176.1 carbohydrate ABC transporter substrate-binding protein [Paenibacillus sp. PL91]